MVEGLLAASWEHRLRLDWEANHCRVRLGNGPEDWFEVPLPKSVIRAALARIAVLCKQHKANSVSPYGGQGELSVGSNSPVVFQVAFANIPDEQSLELVRGPSARVGDGDRESTHGTEKGDLQRSRAEPDASADRHRV